VEMSASGRSGRNNPSTTVGSSQTSPPSSKAAKRTQRHQAFVGRIKKPTKPAKPLKRRRPGKQLTTSLSGLAEALPDAKSTSASQKPDAVEQDPAAPGGMRIRNASLKSRPGAQKKRAALETLERDWFAKNLASMSAKPRAPTESVADGSQQSERNRVWTALRDHVAANLQRIQHAKKT
jgi:hypothetical protein